MYRCLYILIVFHEAGWEERVKGMGCLSSKYIMKYLLSLLLIFCGSQISHMVTLGCKGDWEMWFISWYSICPIKNWVFNYDKIVENAC
jgi:hypothetical protein